jgi:large subunit ribosomal protein L23
MKNKHKLYDVIVKPVMSEKGSNLNALNKYVFFVDKRSNKASVKKSVEGIFDVKVDAVNVINVRGDNVRFKGVKGKQAAKKKAIVTLAQGYKIDLTAGV